MGRFSATVMEHFQDPRNWSKLADPDAVGVAGVPGRGRYLVLYLNIACGRVSESGFQCHGCGATIAAGSMLTELITDETLEFCRELTAEELMQELEGLPPDKRHCAGFAVQALQQALDAYESTDA